MTDRAKPYAWAMLFVFMGLEAGGLAVYGLSLLLAR